MWPLPRFHFQVEWGTAVLSFQEVTGLDIEGEVAEYRHGDGPPFSTISMPGLKASSPVILKNGVFRSDTSFRDWFAQLAARREPVIISLLDDEGSPTMVWTLANAWPARITGTDLTSDGTEVTVETIEILHEGITIESA